MNTFFHAVSNTHVFDEKWAKISESAKVPLLIPQGIHSALMCFAGQNKGRINYGIFLYILTGYGLQNQVEEFIALFIKFKIFDKDFLITKWNKYQKSFMHNSVEKVESVVEKVDKVVEFKLSLVECGVEYLVDKKTNLKLYQAWYFQRVKKGLSCKESYDILTKKGYKIQTILREDFSVKNSTTEHSVEKVESVVEKVETQQRARVKREDNNIKENIINNIIKKTKAKKENEIENEKTEYKILEASDGDEVYENNQIQALTTESKKKIKAHEKVEIEIVLPQTLKAETWESWILHRKELRKPITPQAKKMQIKELKNWEAEGYDINAIVLNAISKGWTGLYNQQNYNNNLNQQNGFNSQQNSTNGLQKSGNYQRERTIQDVYNTPITVDRLNNLIQNSDDLPF